MGGGIKAKVPSLGGMDISGTTPYKVSYFQRKATLARPVQRKPSLLLSPRPLGGLILRLAQRSRVTYGM